PPCHGSGDRSGGLLTPGQALADTLPRLVLRAASGAGLCAPAGRESGNKPIGEPWRGDTKFLPPARNMPGSRRPSNEGSYTQHAPLPGRAVDVQPNLVPEEVDEEQPRTGVLGDIAQAGQHPVASVLRVDW